MSSRSKKTSRTSKNRDTAPRAARSATASAGPTLVDTVDALAAVLGRHDLTSIELEDATFRVVLRRGGEVVAAPVQLASAAPVSATSAAVEATAATAPAKQSVETSDGNISYITSPFVGTFYRSPSPDSAPFVDAGTRIKKGQVLCIVEAMKLMNEIPSEVDGTVVQVLVQNGQPVEYGEPLFKIRAG
jgi:acetyl-CoA carboxylase biotin carboxyl carrier protein